MRHFGCNYSRVKPHAKSNRTRCAPRILA